jgi:hypothetical protein
MVPESNAKMREKAEIHVPTTALKGTRNMELTRPAPCGDTMTPWEANNSSWDLKSLGKSVTTLQNNPLKTWNFVTQWHPN